MRGRGCCSEGPQQVREMGWWRPNKVQHRWVGDHAARRGQPGALARSGGQLAVEQLCRGGPGGPAGVEREGVLAAMKASHKHTERS